MSNVRFFEYSVELYHISENIGVRHMIQTLKNNFRLCSGYEMWDLQFSPELQVLY